MSVAASSPTPRERVRAVRLYVPDRDLETTVVRGIGFRSECPCGWKSDRCASYAMARGALQDHKRHHRPF